ncbi:MAG: DEAD/DEAH box helicase family protein [Isosphaeraceae bacterium]|nr:DEAD/DEAH box helicase family protein [Isosphaeraceae bacterium]
MDHASRRLPSLARQPADEPVPGITQAGEKTKARDILAAIRTLHAIEQENRPATAGERTTLARFGGFGAVALSLFPHALTGRYKDAGWQVLGEELKSLLTPAEYESARATTYNAFYTSPAVVAAMHGALKRMGLPNDATVLEPGCGCGNFMAQAPEGMRFIGVEKDSLTGRIARALYPSHDIRIEPFQDSRLPPVDAVIGNPPFGDVPIKYGSQKLALHDFFFAKSLDALKPGGVLALVTSHFTLDKQNAAVRERLAAAADFLGAIRLPSDAFKREGTPVVTDIVFLRKRAPGEAARHADPDWLATAPLALDGVDASVNRYFLNYPEMVLGTWSNEDVLYPGGYSVKGSGDLEQQIKAAIGRLPEHVSCPAASTTPPPAPAFVPPPCERHVGEGSFFIGNDRALRQVEGGQSVPVMHGQRALKADGTMMGKRLAALVGLRDLARRVLQSQNEGWPEEHRGKARKALNDAYDLFVHLYGPINKTTFSENADGGVTRRMPNLVRFREDPDAMLVMSLEEYDEVTGKAAKAAILQKDVVGKSEPVTSVATAEEGLLVSLDRKGCVDLPFIAGLYGKGEDQIAQELGDLIYLDPKTRCWQTADEYLSGNVRAKLAEAEAAGPEFAGNAEALKHVQPEDVLPGDIDANLGAPWIPESDIQAFAAGLFRVAPASVPIGHLKKDALWSVEADYSAQASVAATSEYGTPRANGTWLLELALNMKTPVIYDTIQGEHGEQRVVNQEDTLAAREKQKLIKDRFRAWVFAEPERADRLVRLYNDTYNNLRPRIFDGSHLDFPGMSKAITLRPHQKDAVWRCISSGNTLLAHAVGAGKTWTAAAAVMKKKQAGLARKPVIAVPNHMLEQFGREFMQLYPNAHLLVATKEDLARDRRKLLTAKIASGEWDAIIVTHSSFERIGMSKEFQERFLREQIAEYDELLRDSASAKAGPLRNIIKTIEKQKARREERIKELAAADKKDDGLVFDELGIDDITVDEAHYFKNLETPTKMERVAGIQTGGSERAFDLFMKARYLGQRHPGRGVTFATGTPISNTMVELYTMQRFLDPEGLESRGIGPFDGWAATFGEVVDSMEISPDGASLRPRSRFAKFTNLPELQQMFRAFADVQTPEMLNLPCPRIKTGKPIVIACPMSDEQRTLQAALVARYERLRRERVDPREDNALAITTDGSKLALDARMLSATAEDFPESKINRLVANVAGIWKESEAIRGTQMIFCDMGVNPTPWGFCVYDEVVEKLVAAGIPRSEIATIGDADSDARKQALFDRVRNGSVRVLIGSTQKMGTGTNVQKRLIAKHDLDAPWKPAEVEQRDGRIRRQGNENEEVALYRYVTEGSFDAYKWQSLENKARFIAQVMTGESAVRRAEDIGGAELSYAEVKAIASGNPAVLTLAEADAEIQRLSVLRKNHDDEQYLARRNLKELPDTIQRRRNRLDWLSTDLATLTQHPHDDFILAGQPCGRIDAMAILAKRLDSLPEHVRETTRFPLGSHRGLQFGIEMYGNGAAEVFLEGAALRHTMLSRESRGPRAVMNALDRLTGSYEEQCATAKRELAIAEGQQRDYQARLGAPFPHDGYLSELTSLRDQLRLGLSGATPPQGAESPSVSELAGRINALKAAQTIEAAPVRLSSRRAAAEEPVTSRIRRRNEAPAVVEDLATTEQEEAPSPPSEPATIQAGEAAAVALPFHTLATSRSRPPSTAMGDDGSPGVIPIRADTGADFYFQKDDHALSGSGDASQTYASDATTQSGRSTMAIPRQRRRTVEPKKDETTADRQPALPPAEEYGPPQQQTAVNPPEDAGLPAPEQSTCFVQAEVEKAASEPRTPIKTPDPRPVMSISLGDTRGSPRVQLRRSHKYKQMQIQFEQQPDEKYLLMLKRAGWRDRTEEEGIWTKQIDPDYRWQSVDVMEREFKQVANAIRTDKGLEPVMVSGVTAA